MHVIILEDRWKERLEFLTKHFPYAIVCRRFRDLQRRVVLGEWDLAMLDHDLNTAPGYEGKNGSVAAKWLAQERPKIKRIIIHSTNARGAQKMEDALRHYYKVEQIRFPDLKRQLKQNKVI